MAMLERPGVEVIQQTSVVAPTVLLPGLPACIVGPCYQIVSPLTSSGTLDSAAQVITAAQIVGSTVTNPIACSGKQLKIKVNGGDPQVITLPVTINSNSLSFTLIKQSINKQLTGAKADFVNSKLVLTSSTKGAAASIELISPANNGDGSTDAYDLLGLDTVEDAGAVIYGASAYTNLEQAIPFYSLPSPLAPVTAVHFVPDQLNLYRYYGNTLYALSTKSAVNQTSWSLGTQGTFRSTTIDDTAAEYQNRLQPALSARSRLIGKPLNGASKTNIVFDPGTEASVTIPLGNNSGNATIKYPDGSGTCYLTVTAYGLQTYLAGGQTIGPYVGKLGNTLTVVLTESVYVDATSLPTVAWAGTTLTITLRTTAHLVVSTFAQLNAALAIATGTPSAKIFTSLAYPAALADVSVAKAFDLTANKTFYLTGGIDPVNFSNPTIIEVAEQKKAGVTGCTYVTGAHTAADLGITGETLSVSLNGSAWKDVLFAGSDVVVTVLNTAMNAVVSGAAATSLASSLVSLHGDALTVLQLKGAAPSGSDFHDSTIQIKASSPKVIEKLFGGAVAKTKTTTTIASQYGHSIATGTTATTFKQTTYNNLAVATLEKVLVPGAQTITLTGVKAMGSVLFATTNALLTSMTAAFKGTIGITHSVGGAVTLTTDADIADITSAAILAADLNTNIVGTTLAGKVSVSAATVGGFDCIIISDLTGIGTVKVTAISQTGGAGVLFTTALHNGATTGTLLNTVGTSSTGNSITVRDNGTDAALQVTAVSNLLANIVFPDTFVFAHTAVQYTALLLDTLTPSTINHTTGDIILNFCNGGVTSVVGTVTDDTNAARLATIFLIENTNGSTIAWSQAWANGVQATAPDYTGRVFHGLSCATVAGDSLYNAGSQMGRIAAIQALSVGTFNFTGAQLVLSDATVSNLGVLSDWYIKAEALDIDTTRDIEPEISVDTLQSIVTVKHGVNTNSAGIAIAGTNAPLYAGYKALRKDVSPASTNPALLIFNNTEEVAAAIGPVTPDNPLAYGLSKAFENSVNVSVTAIGIDETSADAPNGTPEAYGRAFDYLKLKEVYAIAPLTYDRSVHVLLAQHCTAMSAVAGKKERAGIVCVTLPTERESLAVISGVMTISAEIGLGSGKYELTFTDNTKNVVDALNGKKDALGAALVIGNGTTCDVALGIFVDRAGDAYKYIVTKVISATCVQIEATTLLWDAGSGPGTQGNDDGFYKEDAGSLDTFSVVGEVCTVLIRQAAIAVDTTTGKDEQMDALAAYGSSFGMSRFVVKQPASFETELAGTTVVVDGFYACAAEAGMVGFQNPKQGFTNFKMLGFSKPLGSNDTFTEDQMATAAAGGINWMVQDTVGGPVVSRHSITTNISSLKTREWNIIRQVDFVTKLMRNTANPFIGPNNVTQGLLQELSMVLGAAASTANGTVVQTCSVDKVVASTTNPDQILIRVSILPYYAANKIIITLLV